MLQKARKIILIRLLIAARQALFCSSCFCSLLSAALLNAFFFAFSSWLKVYKLFNFIFKDLESTELCIEFFFCYPKNQQVNIRIHSFTSFIYSNFTIQKSSNMIFLVFDLFGNKKETKYVRESNFNSFFFFYFNFFSPK